MTGAYDSPMRVSEKRPLCQATWRAVDRQPHRGPHKAISAASNGLFEPADQAAQRRVGHRFIPVIENAFERFVMLKGRQHCAQDRGHPKQDGQASAKADATERCEYDQDRHSQTEANDHMGRPLDRFRLARQIHVRELGQDICSFTQKLSQQTGS
jgi:hypothetical protein